MSVTTNIHGQGDLVAEALIRSPVAGRMLDIGLGSGRAANAFAEAGWSVSATGYDVDAYRSDGAEFAEGIELHENIDICDMSVFPDEAFDVIWCAHVLEHVLDTGRALSEVRRVLKPGGTFYISVPPFKDEIVGGHVKPGWNVGLLMYVLAVTGFDVRSGAFVRHGYNIFGAVGRGAGPLPDRVLRFANGDLEVLQRYGRFPEDFAATQGFNGDLSAWNWEWRRAPEETAINDTAAPDNVHEMSNMNVTDTLNESGIDGAAQPAHISPMRIAFFVPWITKNRGGTENVGQTMANAMARRGHEVHIFTFDDDRAPSRWPLESSIRLWHLPEGEPTDDLQLIAAVAQANVDLIVGLHMNRAFGRYVRCAHRLGLPVVLSEHIDPRFPQRIGAFTQEERLTYFTGATRIHLLVEAFRETLPDWLQERIAVIPNTAPPARQLADASGQDVAEKTIITASRLVTRKNVDQLIRIFAEIHPRAPDWRLLIVGDGPEMDNLKKLAAKLGLKELVNFTGHTDDPYQYYETAQIFCTTALFEGFGLTNLESMAHGIPCVGFASCNGINEQIIDGVTGRLSSFGDSRKGMAEDLLSLMNDSSLRVKMGMAGLQRYNEYYGTEIVADKWEALFRDAITNQSQHTEVDAGLGFEAKLKDYIFARKEHSF